MRKTHHPTELIMRLLPDTDSSQRSSEEICREHSINPRTDSGWISKDEQEWQAVQ
jgi:hypothetical protein